MQPPVTKRPFAWQPLTWRGVAAFAPATVDRLWLVQLLVALLSAVTVDGFLHRAWFPPIQRAIAKLPAAGEIRGGTLNWQGNSPVVLAENRFLSLAVDLDHAGLARSPAHLQVEFARHGFKVISLLGFVPGRYPEGYALAFNRDDLVPWWGAWSPAILAIVAFAVVLGLLLTWTVLATLYFLPVWLIGFFANRDLNFGASWRLAGAALMPGALFMCAAIFLYTVGAVDLILLGVATAAHFVIAWVYVAVAPFYAPPLPETQPLTANPFVPSSPAGAAAGTVAPDPAAQPPPAAATTAAPGPQAVPPAAPPATPAPPAVPAPPAAAAPDEPPGPVNPS